MTSRKAPTKNYARLTKAQLIEELTATRGESPSPQSDGSEQDSSPGGSEGIYRAIVEATSEGVWVSDLERRTTFVNQRLADMFGCQPVDMIKRPVSDFVPADQHAQLALNLDLRAQGIPGQSEYRLQRRDKSYFWVMANSSPLLDEHGDVAGALVTLTDITEQKEAQDAIKESEERYRKLTEGSIQGIGILQSDQVVFVNPAFADLLGYEPDEIIGRGVNEFVAPSFQDVVNDRRRVRLSGGDAVSMYEMLVLHKSGREIWVDQLAQVVQWDGNPAVQVSVIDISARITALEALKESEERFRDFAASASDWLWETDTEGRIRWESENPEINPGIPFRRIEGMTRQEIAGNLMSEEAWATYQQAIDEHRDIRDFEYSYANPNGDVRYARVNGKALFDANGSFVGHRGVATDITKRRRDEERLDRLAAAMDQMTEMVALYDDQDRLVTFNKPFKEDNRRIADLVVPGTTFEELARAAAARGLTPVAREGNRDWLTERLDRHRNPAGAFQLQRSGGGWDLIHEQRLADGGIVTVVSDITPLKRAEDSLRESENRFRLLFDNAEISIWDEDFTGAMKELSKLRAQGITDLQTYLTENLDEAFRIAALVQINDVNEATLALYGVATKNEFIESLDGIMTEESIFVFIGVLSAMWNGDPYFSTEVSHKTFDGRDITVIVSVPIPHDATEYDHVPVCVLDITEHKQAERQIVAAKEEAEYANRTKSEFLANMSHELRTPLNAILGFAQIIRDQTFGRADTDRYIDYAGDIHGSGEHLLEIINDLLDLSKIEAGKADINEIVFPVDHAIQDCVSLVAGRASESRLLLNAEHAGEYLEILADERMFKQMLLNLLSNAIKFTKPDGQIEIGVRHEEDGSLDISVSDTGIGIEEDDIPLVLSPFGQIANVLTRDHVGTGLGLPLVSSLAELHGGKLMLESSFGVGTKATVWFPPERVFTSPSS